MRRALRLMSGTAPVGGVLVVLLLGLPRAWASPWTGEATSGIAQQSPAPAPVQAEVTLVHATSEGDGGIDSRIGKLPKFGDYKTYRLLSRTNVTIPKAKMNIAASTTGMEITMKSTTNATTRRDNTPSNNSGWLTGS